MRRLLVLLCIFILCEQAEAGIADNEIYEMTVIVLDASSNDTLETRCCVSDSLGVPWYPDSPNAFYHTPDGGYFYSPGTFTMDVPGGNVILKVARGPEYMPQAAAHVITSDTTIVLELERLVDMRSLGWYPGDTHVHINHEGGHYTLDPSDAHYIGRAEDLSVVNCLDNEYHFTGAIDAVSDERCIVYMSEEYRNNTLGHCSMPGMKRLIYPLYSRWWPMISDVADSVNAQNGPLLIAAHPVSTPDFDFIESWPGTGLARELPVAIIQGGVDAFEVMNYSNCYHGGIDIWMYHNLLNSGFKLPPCAGTDASVNRIFDRPMGGFRTYVYLGEEPLDYYSWLGGIKDGRTFVTNGPLFTRFEVMLWGAGEELLVYKGVYQIPVGITVECAFPMLRAEVIVNGRIVQSIYPSGDPTRIDADVKVWVNESSWIAVRVRGDTGQWPLVGHILFAHTGPFYIDMIGEPAAIEKDSTGNLASWVQALIDLTLDQGEYESPADSARAMAEYQAAQQHYTILSNAATSVEDPDDDPDSPAPSLEGRPNPFSDKVTLSFSIPNQPAKAMIEIYDVRGRLVRRFDGSRLGPGRHEVVWDGRNQRGTSVASGIYFCRIRTGNKLATGKLLLVR
jgi:hypothetical protein